MPHQPRRAITGDEDGLVIRVSEVIRDAIVGSPEFRVLRSTGRVALTERIERADLSQLRQFPLVEPRHGRHEVIPGDEDHANSLCADRARSHRADRATGLGPALAYGDRGSP